MGHTHGAELRRLRVVVMETPELGYLTWPLGHAHPGARQFTFITIEDTQMGLYRWNPTPDARTRNPTG